MTVAIDAVKLIWIKMTGISIILSQLSKARSPTSISMSLYTQFTEFSHGDLKGKTLQDILTYIRF